MKNTITVYVTRARCRRCGQQVTATNKLDADLMNKHPKDGQWLCRDCRTQRRRR